MNISEETVKKISDLIQDLVIDKAKVKSELDKWKNVPVYIGVIGERGSGKSTLINALLDLYPSDDGAAPIDCVDCTKFPTPFPYANRSSNRESARIVLWDLPGVGTREYPLETYLDKITVLDNEAKSYIQEKYTFNLIILFDNTYIFAFFVTF
jgi:predicted GTPase